MLALLAGCTINHGERATTHECPRGETCSPLTPDGLIFTGTAIDDNQIFAPDENLPTAVGGTQVFTLSIPGGHQLALPYTAEAGGAAIAIASQDGPNVTVNGIADAFGELKIRDTNGLLMDEIQVQSQPVGTIEIEPNQWETYGGSEHVYMAGRGTIGIRLGEIDTSMQVDLPGGQRVAWDEIEVGTALGTQTLTVTAGDQPAMQFPVTVVDTADAIAALMPPASVTAGTPAMVCFEALNASRSIVGAPWSFMVDGVRAEAELLQVNCAAVSTMKSSGTVVVTASAAGASASVSLPVTTR